MQDIPKSILNSVINAFLTEAHTTAPESKMRLLSDDELRTVAGGPEVEVDNGN